MKPIATLLFAASLAFAQDSDEDRKLREGEEKPRAGERAAREPAPRPPDGSKVMPPELIVHPVEPTGVAPGGFGPAACGEGFAVAEDQEIVSYDRDGKSRAVLVKAGARVERFWVARDGKRVAYVAKGTLYVAAAGGASVEIGAAPAGAVAFSSDGKEVAYVEGGQAHVCGVDGATRRKIGAHETLLGDAVAFAADGKRLFALVATADATKPDGVGVVDLTRDGGSVTRLTTAAGATLRGLAVSPNGRFVMFVQVTAAEPSQAALRLLSADGGDLQTIARAAAIDGATFSHEGSRVHIAALGANRLWNLYEVGVEKDLRTGEFPLRKLTEETGAGFRSPCPAADGMWVFGARVGEKPEVVRVRLR